MTNCLTSLWLARFPHVAMVCFDKLLALPLPPISSTQTVISFSWSTSTLTVLSSVTAITTSDLAPWPLLNTSSLPTWHTQLKSRSRGQQLVSFILFLIRSKGISFFSLSSSSKSHISTNISTMFFVPLICYMSSCIGAGEPGCECSFHYFILFRCVLTMFSHFQSFT